MLAVGSRFAPIDWPGGIVNLGAIERNVLAVALHGQLLQIGWEPLEVLLVRQNRSSFGTEEIVIPHRQKPHQDGQVALKWRAAKVLIHFVKTVEHSSEIIRPNG